MSKVVFVGNVPYNMYEKQLMDFFDSEVGDVLGVRLQFDRDKARGCGYCEFKNERAARAAVRRVDGKTISGRRLRVNLAEPDPLYEGMTTVRGQIVEFPLDPSSRGRRNSDRRALHQEPDSGRGRERDAEQEGEQRREHDGERDDDREREQKQEQWSSRSRRESLTPARVHAWMETLPQGIPLEHGKTAIQAINNLLANTHPSTLFAVLAEMQSLVRTQPDAASTLLEATPQLRYALARALTVLNVVSDMQPEYTPHIAEMATPSNQSPSVANGFSTPTLSIATVSSLPHSHTSQNRSTLVMQDTVDAIAQSYQAAQSNLSGSVYPLPAVQPPPSVSTFLTYSPVPQPPHPTEFLMHPSMPTLRATSTSDTLASGLTDEERRTLIDILRVIPRLLQ